MSAHTPTDTDTQTAANGRTNFSFLPPDDYNASGPDGKGRNRLRVEVMSPAPRCPFKPLTYEAAWESQHRPEHARLSWASFGLCEGSACASCPAFSVGRERLYAPAVVREDADGRAWLMSRREGGWAEFGYPYRTWGDLLAAWDVILGNRGHDEHGAYIYVRPANRKEQP
jgi:hypothetical protein